MRDAANDETCGNVATLTDTAVRHITGVVLQARNSARRGGHAAPKPNKVRLLHRHAAMTIRVAFIGTGNMARLHLHALRRVGTPHQVVGVHDRDEPAAREFATLAATAAYRTLDELLTIAQPNLVHICTPAGTHFEPARRALLAGKGAHVYVEKPFVDTPEEARELLDIAAKRRLLICAGHQQLRDSAYVALLERAPQLGEIVQVDSSFAFRPMMGNSIKALANQLVDILPHPLYTLVDALERLAPRDGGAAPAIEIASLVATHQDLHAVLRAGKCCGRLSVSLRARPIASFLTVSGTRGALTADFLRSSVVGAANPGDSPVEKAANPLLEAWQLALRTVKGVAGRVLRGDYPGLAELIGDFYAAVEGSTASPLAPAHLRHVVALCQEMAGAVQERQSAPALPPPVTAPDAPLVVVTGARGFFGKAITKQLARRGYRVRGISRSVDEEDPNVHEWLRLDLSRPISPDAFAGAECVVHAAAATSGGFDSQQRHSIDATHHVLEAMRGAGVARLVYISSISVLRPPRTPWEQQNESTPLTGAEQRQYGAYTWGKSLAEQVVTTEAPGLGIETKIIRPGALLDWSNPETPGIMGRRLFGKWHLGFGRPGLSIPVIDVAKAAAVVAWSVAQFTDAPPLLNLFDPDIETRSDLLGQFKQRGWRGRFLWMPLPIFAALVHSARYALTLPRFKRPTPLALYGVLRPRRYDPSLSRSVLARATQEPARHDVPALAASPAWSS